MTTTEPERAGSILVGVGDSYDTHAALAFAAAEAGRRGARVRLVHVFDRPSPLLTDSALISFEAVELVAEDLVAAASERLAHLAPDLPVERVVRRGNVGRVLAELATESEMVVLQHRERDVLARLVSGSVVVHVAGHATVPVVSVPERWRPRDVTAVTVAVDGHAGQEALLEQAFAAASAYDAELTIVHAWFLGTAYDDVITSRTPLDQWAELARERLLELTEDVRSRHPQVSVRIDVRHQPPVDAIVAAAQHCNLLLLGRRRRAHAEHLGPVARAVVSASPVPVVVVPGPVASAWPYRSGKRAGTVRA